MLIGMAILAFVGGAICLMKAYHVGRQILALPRDEQDTDAFAGSISQVFTISNNDHIRSLQKILYRWLAASLLCFTIVKFVSQATMNAH